jgi:hypothetical protein
MSISLTSKVLAFLLAVVSGMCVVLYLDTRRSPVGPGGNCQVPVVTVGTEDVKRTTVLTVSPDGTKTTTTTRETRRETTATPVAGTTNRGELYSVGVYVDVANRKNLRTDIGMRLGDLPAEAVVGGGVRDNNWFMEAGIRYRF